MSGQGTQACTNLSHEVAQIMCQVCPCTAMNKNKIIAESEKSPHLGRFALRPPPHPVCEYIQTNTFPCLTMQRESIILFYEVQLRERIKKMGKAMYSNRYDSINRAVHAIGELGCKTTKEVASAINLSRQNVLDVLKHAQMQGYVISADEPYRWRKDGSIFATRKVWRATEYGATNAAWYCKAMDKYKNRKGMKPLL